MAVKYKFVDTTKLGLSVAQPPNPNAPAWVAATVYAALAVVENGGFLFRTVAGGTAGTGTIGPTPQNLTDNTVTWVLMGATSGLGAQDATALQELGLIVIAKDPTHGIGEFEYVKFTGTVTAGDFVFVDRQGLTAVRTPGAAAIGVLGVAMANQVAGQFGWVMIRGVHDGANVVTGATVGLAGGTATAGRANATGTVANYSFDGVFIRVTGVANVGCVELFYPTCSGALI